MKDFAPRRAHSNLSALPRRPPVSVGAFAAAESRHAVFQTRVNSSRTVQRLAGLQRVANAGQNTATGPQRLDEDDELRREPIQRAENRATLFGDLPGPLRDGIERLSGISMEGVRVHRNSTAPAAVGAHAFAQGRDIHLGPGQDRHLPHEAWHVVQQAQRRVLPTIQAQGVPINDDAVLEREADQMGALAQSEGLVQRTRADTPAPERVRTPGTAPGSPVMQRLVGFEFQTIWELKKRSTVKWDSDTVLASGTGWKLSPDEISGHDAVIEFKTDPFNVDGDDYEELLKPVAASIGHLQGYVKESLLTLPTEKFSMLPTQSNYKGDIAVKPNGPVTAKPQATGGVRRDLILDFYKDMLKSDKPADLLPGQGHKDVLKQSLEYVDPITRKDTASSRAFAGVVVFLADLIRRFQIDKETYENYVQLAKERLEERYKTAREDAEQTFKSRSESLRKKGETEKSAITFDWIIDKIGDEEKTKRHQEVDNDVESKIEALRKTLLEEVVETKKALLLQFSQTESKLKDRYTPSYGKARAPALPRVAFNDLPLVSNAHLLKHVLLAAGLGENDGDKPIYPMGFKLEGEWDKVTIKNWIASIQKDKGTGTGVLWSARSLGEGDVGFGDKKGTGIPFELRGLPGMVPYEDWLTWARPYLDYFRQLNAKDKPPK